MAGNLEVLEMRSALIAASLTVFPSIASAFDLEDLLAEANQACEVGGGNFSVEGPRAEDLELTGDETLEVVADEAMFYCSNSPNLYVGSGGSMMHVWADGKHFAWLVHDWEVMNQQGQPILVLFQDGGECGQPAKGCVTALAWDGAAFSPVPMSGSN
ncbi:hypothetical protein [Tabrizicola sp.]|uniref:hypothetical protein n=1 Tax=Tabrizicola sp. TaxID=2005166 RepID=UPI003F2CFB4E